MPRLTQKQSRNLIDRYMHVEGWYPPGTDPTQGLGVTIGALAFDDPPLDDDPHLQKRRVALDLMKLFFLLGASLASPLAELKMNSNTVRDLADWCALNNTAAR